RERRAPLPRTAAAPARPRRRALAAPQTPEIVGPPRRRHAPLRRSGRFQSGDRPVATMRRSARAPPPAPLETDARRRRLYLPPAPRTRERRRPQRPERLQGARA